MKIQKIEAIVLACGMLFSVGAANATKTVPTPSGGGHLISCVVDKGCRVTSPVSTGHKYHQKLHKSFFKKELKRECKKDVKKGVKKEMRMVQDWTYGEKMAKARFIRR